MAVQILLSYSTIVTMISLLVIPYSSPLEFNYAILDQNKHNLIIQGKVRYLGSGIELTRNETDQIGRVSHVLPMQLWNDSSGRKFLADFNTNFSFMVYSNSTVCGDGITFFLTKLPLFGIPERVDGSGLGLVQNGNEPSAVPLVAVEFDTFRNDFDPQDLARHVGMDVNSTKSKVTTSWSCDITSRNVYNATVSYNSSDKNLSVVFTGYENKVAIRQYLSYEIDLADFLPSWVNIGFSASNGLYTSTHILRSWSFRSNLESETSPNPETDSQKEDSNSVDTGLVVGLSVGAFVFVCLIGLIGIFLLKKRAKRDEDDDLDFDLYMDNDFERNSGAKKFSYDELLAATNNFAEDEKLGQGGFGGVYRGFLKNLNSYVAIKKVSSVSNQGIKEYASEVKIISRLRHKNLVQLIGWCHRERDLLLIYEFMSNGSLDSHLFKQKGLLTWARRYNIARGLASALVYLHEEWEQCVLHRDIKSSNIMLDSQFNAKLGDFGLARLVDHAKGSQTTVLAGTLGYMAPECVTTGRASRESDVYSFGVVILEIACGSKAIESNAKEGQKGLVQRVWELYGTNKILEAYDPKLCGDFDEQQMERLMIVGLWCAHPDYTFRPSIKQAIHVLDFEAPLPVLPAEMPVPTYLPRLVRPFLSLSGTSTSASTGPFNSGNETRSSVNTSHCTTSSGSASAFTTLSPSHQ